jgi:hypothetical protein
MPFDPVSEFVADARRNLIAVQFLSEAQETKVQDRDRIDERPRLVFEDVDALVDGLASVEKVFG